ncbi:MAG: ATP-binding protein [Muribaculaceae bacterium]|nr:ATP-binding protein [Muribaculaceae bacterium]
MEKYKMTLDLNVLNHLGLNLYSNTPAVLSEVIANAWDADATEVVINCSQEEDVITIIDNGCGMTTEDINNKFLCVGYQKRKNGEAKTRQLGRAVMGRKGIGKLSLLSIADTIKIYSKKDDEKNAFCMSRNDIEREITSTNRSYAPRVIEFEDFPFETGTKIVIRNFKKNINRTAEFLRKRLARRFSVIGKDFNIILCGTPISIEDRDFYRKIQFVWPIGEFDVAALSSYPNISIQPPLDGKISERYKISGWIGSSEKPSDLDGNNKISIITRGKLAQEDLLATFGEGGVYASYLIGEIHADFLDDDNASDISTSNRQQYIEDDERYQALKSHTYKLLKSIQGKWTDLRKEKSTDKVTSSIPAIKEWYDSLRPSTKKYAQRLFASIESMRFDDDDSKKRELLKYGILAFERLKLTDKLSLLDNNDNMIDDIVKFGDVFADLQDIEATLYWEIANERLKIVKQLSESCDQNAKEKVLQKYIFDNLWLLNPSWERAVAGTERIEQGVGKEFDIINAGLTDEEKKARLDIRYISSTGKHIIVELKRYIPTYKVNVFSLHDQIYKYRKALHKCLRAIGREHEPIEAICIIGKEILPDEMTLEEANQKLAGDARIMTYDQIIFESMQSYSEYLKRQSGIGKIRKIIESI